MRRYAVLLLSVCLLTACAKKGESTAAAASMPSAANATQKQSAPETRYLAYEHHLTVSAREAQVRPLYEKLINACQADQANQCTLLDSQIETGNDTFASLQFRLKAAGVAGLSKVAAAGGDLASQSTHVEDLATPITDNERRIAMLKSYEQGLLDLEKRPGNSADNLIKLAQELANVQSQLETAAGENAHLMERVNLQTLTIHIQASGGHASWSPVREALGDFSHHLADATAGTITALAYLLPWSLLLLIVGVITRKIWRWRK